MLQLALRKWLLYTDRNFSELKIPYNTAVDFADLECEASGNDGQAVVKERDTMLEDAKKRMAEMSFCNLEKRNMEESIAG